MSKLYIKEVTKCRHCPNYEGRDFEIGGGWQDWCRLSKKDIIPMSKIPIWCELPDKQ
jgi:hypothetical protein